MSMNCFACAAVVAGRVPPGGSLAAAAEPKAAKPRIVDTIVIIIFDGLEMKTGELWSLELNPQEFVTLLSSSTLDLSI